MVKVCPLLYYIAIKVFFADAGILNLTLHRTKGDGERTTLKKQITCHDPVKNYFIHLL